ncbi:MAG: sulfatase [Planctomycetota bacterium]
MSKPNIILINCDDLGYGDLGCYGSTRNSTPNLDRLAAEGTRFTDFYMASPVCSPSRGGMLTGCYPPRIGFGDFDGAWVLFPGHAVGMSSREKTVAELLKDSGYATQIVGKWHCGDQPEFLPTRHGFDHWYGLPYSNDMGRQLKPDGSLRGKPFPPLPLMRDEEVMQEQPDQAGLTERYVEEGIRFMRDNADGPFLLYFAHMYVHLPLFVPERFAKESRNGRYGAAVAAIDWATGMLMRELDRLGIAEDTLVIFTSDNGSRAGDEGGSNAPCRGQKGQTWDGGMRLPAIVRWPGHVPAGRVCSELWSSIDLLPTFAALAGAELDQDRQIDGLDCSELLLGGERSPREHFFYYFGNTLAAVRDRRYKLHNQTQAENSGRAAYAQPELYDLHEDIGETSDIASREPAIVERLQAAFEEMRAELGDAATGVTGRACREKGRVDCPATLTQYDEDHPYYMAEYDLCDAG